MIIFRTVPTWQRGSWIAPLTVFACALLLFSLNLDRPPDPDELHHVLAAQHLLETGRPMIADGEYWRGILHTWMVAISYQAFGEGLASARFPAVLLAALVAPALFLWVRREAGNTAAWLTALLYVTSPFTVEIAQFSRFYALQVFTFVLGSLCVYYAFARSASLLYRLCLGAMATSLIGLAVSVQDTTLVGVVGIGTWGLGLLALRTFQDPTAHQPVRRYCGDRPGRGRRIRNRRRGHDRRHRMGLGENTNTSNYSTRTNGTSSGSTTSASWSSTQRFGRSSDSWPCLLRSGTPGWRGLQSVCSASASFSCRLPGRKQRDISVSRRHSWPWSGASDSPRLHPGCPAMLQPSELDCQKRLRCLSDSKRLRQPLFSHSPASSSC